MSDIDFEKPKSRVNVKHGKYRYRPSTKLLKNIKCSHAFIILCVDISNMIEI